MIQVTDTLSHYLDEQDVQTLCRRADALVPEGNWEDMTEEQVAIMALSNALKAAHDGLENAYSLIGTPIGKRTLVGSFCDDVRKSVESALRCGH